MLQSAETSSIIFHMTSPVESRNIIDHYHYWKHDAILADLDSKRHNYSVLCSNLYNDFNISTVVRNANAFLAREVIIYGSKQWDRRGAVGTHNYNRMRYFKEDEFDDMLEYIADCHLVAFDNVDESSDVSTYEWPSDKHTLLMFGQEQVGLPEPLLRIANDVVYIPQYGSVRSLNVGTASGIAMHEFCRSQPCINQSHPSEMTL